MKDKILLEMVICLSPLAVAAGLVVATGLYSTLMLTHWKELNQWFRQ